jgi:hypothetical protein
MFHKKPPGRLASRGFFYIDIKSIRSNGGDVYIISALSFCFDQEMETPWIK